MASPDITVILITRNRADVLPMALAHLEQQTYPAARFEVLAVDRGSTDATAAVLKRYAAGAPMPTRFLELDPVSRATACNRALADAHGETVLLLDEDLLAGPGLVESHMKLQDLRDRHCAVVGRLAMHPQVDAATFTRWHDLLNEARQFDGQPLRFPDWRACNLSLPRARVLAVGGFDEGFDVPGLDDVELAYRLERLPLPGFYSANAAAYLWRSATIASEARRFYFEGYSLHRLLDCTDSKTLRNRYRTATARKAVSLRAAFAPLCRVLAENLATGTALFRVACRRTMEASFVRGFRDAHAGKPPITAPD